MASGYRTRTRQILAALWADGQGWILVFVALGWSVVLGARFVFPVLFPHLETAFQLDRATLGLLFSLLWVGYAIGQFPSGIVADRYGERRVLVLGVSLAGATLVLVGFSPNTLVLSASMVLFGLGSSLYGPTRFTVMSDTYPDYDGTAIGITQAAGELGNAVFPVVAGGIAAYFSWRLGVLYLVPLFLVVAVSLQLMMPVRTSGPESTFDEVSVASIRSLLGNILNRPVLLFTAVLALTSFAVQGMTSFYPTYLIDIKELSPGVAATLFGLFFLTAIVIQPVSGAVGDTLDARTTLLAFMGLFCLSLAALPFVDHLVALVVVTILLGSFFGVPPVAVAQINHALPPEMRGSGLGLLRTVYFVLAATGPVFVGILGDRQQFDEAFFVLSAAVLVGLVLFVVGYDR